MGVAVILVMWPRCNKQTFVSPAQGGALLNLALNGPVISEEKLFEECGRRTDGRRTTEPALYFKLINEPKGSNELQC